MSDGFWYAVTALIVALGIVALVWVSGNAVQAAHVEGTKRIVACTEAGGTWVNSSNMCIGGDK